MPLSAAGLASVLLQFRGDGLSASRTPDPRCRKKNYCLGLGRQGLAVNDPQWSLVTVASDPVDANVFRRGGVNLFPLFLYPDRCTQRRPVFQRDGAARESEPGVPCGRGESPAVVLRCRRRGRSEKTFGPEDVFHYAYAVLHSPTYRERYAEFLKIDFPRLPLTSNVGLFRALAAKGADLVALHLLESPKLDDFLTDWPVKGDNLVDKVQYAEKDGRVWINKTQYFGGVPKAVWEFHVGGYQVCDKWLKDRKGRKLTYDDTQHYQKVVVALSETTGLMAEIDDVIRRHGGWPVQ